MTVAELVSRMLEAGATPEVIGIAVQAMVEQPSAGAARMRRYRAARVASGMPLAFDGNTYRAALVERDGEGCVYCGDGSGDYAVDHMFPIAQGGTDALDNLAIACRKCNGRKAGRTPTEAGMAFVRDSAKSAHVRYVRSRSLETAPQGKSGFPPDPLPVKTQPPKESPPMGDQRKGTDDVSEAFGLWNETARRLSLPTASKLTADRRTRLKARLAEHGLDGWRAALEQLQHSPHCLGQNNRQWRADLEFLLSPQKFARLLDGGYRGTGPPEDNTLGGMLREIAQRQSQRHETDYDLVLPAIAAQ